MKKNSSTILLILMFFVGLSLLLYPSFSDYWNSFTSTKAISTYAEQVAGMDDDKYAEIWQEAWDYNVDMKGRKHPYRLSAALKERYEKTLDVSGLGVMGYVEIPSIKCSLPIYHGTEEAVLQVAVGHLQWTSLPVGGESTHCVVSGHRGLPSAKLFTDLDKLVIGDVFMMRVLDEVLTYEVDQILIVEPNEVQSLHVVEGEDLCTLVTCTPYGINSHRLLVRGHRIENIEEARSVRITADAMQIEPVIVAPFVAAPILLILLIVLLVTTRKRKN